MKSKDYDYVYLEYLECLQFRLQLSFNYHVRVNSCISGHNGVFRSMSHNEKTKYPDVSQAISVKEISRVVYCQDIGYNRLCLPAAAAVKVSPHIT